MSAAAKYLNPHIEEVSLMFLFTQSTYQEQGRKQCLETVFERLQQQVCCQPRRQDSSKNFFFQKWDLILDCQVAPEMLQHVFLDEVPHPHFLLFPSFGNQLTACEHEVTELGHFIPHIRDPLPGFGGDTHYLLDPEELLEPSQLLPSRLPLLDQVDFMKIKKSAREASFNTRFRRL